MDNIGLKKQYSSLIIDHITVIKLKTLAKQRGIKGYYTLRIAELIQKLKLIQMQMIKFQYRS